MITEGKSYCPRKGDAKSITDLEEEVEQARIVYLRAQIALYRAKGVDL